MEQNMEIEFKNILTKEEFDTIAGEFKFTAGSFQFQENHYFDTSSFSLKELGAAVRIRVKNGKIVLTIKQPSGNGLLETHQAITEKEMHGAVDGGSLPPGPVSDQACKLGVDAKMLRYFGTLSTSRAEVDFENGLLVLDHSKYLDAEDYELEYEAAEFHEGKRTFQELLARLGIPQRQTANKIRRFYERKQKLGLSGE